MASLNCGWNDNPPMASPRGKGGWMKGLVLVLLLAIGMYLAANLQISHADKHGLVVDQIRQCNQGNHEFWFNPESKHFARFCDLRDGREGLQILRSIGDWRETLRKFYTERINTDLLNEITAFPVDDVASYLTRTGYIEVNEGIRNMGVLRVLQQLGVGW